MSIKHRITHWICTKIDTTSGEWGNKLRFYHGEEVFLESYYNCGITIYSRVDILKDGFGKEILMIWVDEELKFNACEGNSYIEVVNLLKEMKEFLWPEEKLQEIPEGIMNLIKDVAEKKRIKLNL